METVIPDNLSQVADAVAQLITDSDGLSIAAGLGSIPADERIFEPKRAEYLPPAYLKKTAPQLAPEFGALLDLLKSLNGQFVGERTVKAQAELSLTGEHEWLEEQFFNWCRSYFTHRGNHDRLSSQNGNDPWHLYRDCIDEFDRLLGKHILQPSTINSSVLNLSHRYITSAFAGQVLRPEVSRYAATGRDRFSNALNRNRSIVCVGRYDIEVKKFTKFIMDIAENLPSAYSPIDKNDWFVETEAKIAGCAEDLNYLRFVLAVLDINQTEKQQLTDQLWGRLAWDVYHGMSVAAVLTSSSDERTTALTSNECLAFRRDGWLCHREYPWIRVQPDYLRVERWVEYAVNWYVLDTLTTPLYQIWDRLEPEPMVSRGLEADATEEEQIAAIALVLARPDVAEGLTPVVRNNRSRLPQLWLTELEKITTDHFQCEWSQAKGSERKVYRKGGKQFKFGRHGTDRRVSPGLIKNCLRKLDIALTDFVAACR